MSSFTNKSLFTKKTSFTKNSFNKRNNIFFEYLLKSFLEVAKYLKINYNNYFLTELLN